MPRNKQGGKRYSQTRGSDSRRQQRRRRRLMLAGVVLAVLALGIYALSEWYETLRIDRLTRTLVRYVRERPPDRWLFERAPHDDPHALLALSYEFEAHKVMAERALQRYRTASPLAERTAKAVPLLYATVYHQGASTTVSVGRNLAELQAMVKSGVELCFIPLNEFQLPLHPSALYYNHAWGAVMMLGLAWPEKVFAGLLFHELGHRLRHLTEKAPSALAPPGSSLYTREELDMHALEDAVFDAATEGKYGKHIEAFIAKNRRVRNVYQLISRLTLDDLHALDALLGCERCGPSIARLLAAQYLVSIGTRYLAATVEPARQSEKSIKLYQWYIGQFTAHGYGK